MADKADIYERRRCAFLEALAYTLDDPFIAVIGHGSGRELLALAKGVRRPHPLRKGSATGSVLCFHYVHDEVEEQWLRDVQCVLTDYANAQRQKGRRIWRPTPVALVVRFVASYDGSRDAWDIEIARLLGGGPERLGLVCHMGTAPGGSAKRMLADIEALTPLMSDRTEVVLCGMQKTCPQQTFRKMVRQGGWSGLWRTGAAMGELRRLPFPMKE